jgi:hypothetical protein
MAKKIRHQICANCEYLFKRDEHYCPNCGQENHIPNQPVRFYFHELIESLLHLDSKALFTLKTIFRFPGKITKEYNQNKRARYTPPLRFYVFVSFVYFLLLQIPSKNEHSTTPDKTTAINTTSHSVNPTDTGHDSLHSVHKSVNNELIDSTVIPDEDSIYTLKIGDIDFRMRNEDVIKYKSATPEQIDSLIIESNLTPGYFTRTLYRQIIKSFNADENFKQQMKDKAYKFSSVALFFLMPAFAFLLFLLYYRRKMNYYEFLIFSIHYHTLVFLVLSISHFISLFFTIENLIGLSVFLFLIWYLAKAMRLNYPATKWTTFFKLITLSVMYSIILLVVFFFVVLLGWWFV